MRQSFGKLFDVATFIGFGEKRCRKNLPLADAGNPDLVKRELIQLAIDVVISLLLFILACAMAGAASTYLTPNVRWLYSLWFAIGMLPFCFYARYRGVFNFDRWDIVAYSPFPFVIGLTQAWIDRPAALIFAAIAMVTIGGTIRRKLPAT